MADAATAPAPAKDAERPEVILYTDGRSPECRKARNVLRGLLIPFDERNVEKDPAAREELLKLSSDGKVPTLDVAGYGVVVQPNVSELKTALEGWGNRGQKSKLIVLNALGTIQLKKAAKN